MKVITDVITPLTAPGENPSKREAPAGWRRGYAADCKSVKTGSIPVPASKSFQHLGRSQAQKPEGFGVPGSTSDCPHHPCTSIWQLFRPVTELLTNMTRISFPLSATSNSAAAM